VKNFTAPRCILTLDAILDNYLTELLKSWCNRADSNSISSTSQTASSSQAPQQSSRAMTRRNFLWLGWPAWFASLAPATRPPRGSFPQLIYEPSQKFNAAPRSPLSRTVDTRWLKRAAHVDHQYLAGLLCLWARCTHLGCTPNWFADQSRFPCLVTF